MEDLNPREAQEILLRLWDRGGSIKNAIAEEIDQYLGNVDVEEVAKRVFSDLDLLTREDLWGRSGATAHGYNDPADVAWEMVEEVIVQYLAEIDRYWQVGKKEEAIRCCLGVLAGIYDFEMQSDSNFKEWAQDDPREAFAWVHGEWIRKYRDEQLTSRLQNEIAARCPEWT